MPNANWIMHASRDLLVARHLGGPETPKIRDRAAEAYRWVAEHKSAPSPNMFKLGIMAGFELGLAKPAEVDYFIELEMRCSWYNRACALPGAQFTWSHAIAEVFPEVCAYLSGFEQARVNIMRIANYVRLVDRFQRGRCYTTGMRSPAHVERADFLDDLAEMLVTRRMQRTKKPSMQEVAWLIQAKAPELLAPNDLGLPPVAHPTTVKIYEHAVSVETPTMPQGRYGGPVRVLSRFDGAFVRYWLRTPQIESLLFPGGFGVELDRITLPQGVIS